MKRYSTIALIIMIVSCIPLSASSVGTTSQTSLNADSPSARMLEPGTQFADLARIDITAVSGALYLHGIQIGTDVSDGLKNFSEIRIYNTDNSIVANYPSPGTQTDTVEFASVTIGQTTKTFIVRGTIASSASGIVRVGFKDLIFQNSEPVEKVGLPVYSNAITFSGTTPTPTTSASPTPIPTPSATPTPISSTGPTPASRGFVSLAALSLNDGDTISATGSSDPDIYIANSYGYKRLFLNPIIFSFYGHLGGFAGVKSTSSTTRDTLVTSGLFRNCETNDSKVYGLQVTAEDSGVLHWVDTTGAQAVRDDPDFFKKVFCINTNEFNWYQKGSSYTSVNQIPEYSR